MQARFGGKAGLAGVIAAGLVWSLAGSSAQACGPTAPLSPIGLPRAGATGVSTATSLIVLSRDQQLARLTLQAGGQAIALSEPVTLGGGRDGSVGPAGFWQVTPLDGVLVENAEHVLTASSQGTTVEVTRFTTAGASDNVAGVAPVARAVHLWRVRYPVAHIGSGNCVFAEYHSFATVDYDAAVIPNTPPSSVVHAFHLAPAAGGSEQQFFYTGEAPFAGEEPTGAYPQPTAPWQPELDAARSYCLTITAFGDGDRARPQLESQPVCATVVQLSAAGAPPPGGGGCAVAGGSPRLAGLLLVAVLLGARRRRR